MIDPRLRAYIGDLITEVSSNLGGHLEFDYLDDDTLVIKVFSEHGKVVSRRDPTLGHLLEVVPNKFTVQFHTEIEGELTINADTPVRALERAVTILEGEFTPSTTVTINSDREADVVKTVLRCNGYSESL